MITAKMKNPTVKIEVNSYGTNTLHVDISMLGTSDFRSVIQLLLDGKCCADDITVMISSALEDIDGCSVYNDKKELVSVRFFDK